MIRRTTWIVVGVFLLALAAAVWWSRSGGTFDPTPTPAPSLTSLWSLSPSDVESIQVTAGGEEDRTVRAQRDPDGGWILEQPVADFADGGRLEQAVTSLLAPVPRDTIEGASMAEFELTDPRYRVTLGVRDGTSLSLEVGGISPTGEVTYVRLPAAEDVHFLRTTTLQPIESLLTTPPIATPTAEASATSPLEATESP